MQLKRKDRTKKEGDSPGTPNFLYKNNGDGTFTKMTQGDIVTDAAYSQAASCEDIDNDGDMDVFVANLNQDNFLYRNEGNNNHWITIQCQGTTSNTKGVGTRIKVKSTTAGKTIWQMQEIFGITGLGGQTSFRAHFGLMDAANIEEINVQWPSGTIQTFTNVNADQFLTINEDIGIITSAATGSSNYRLTHRPGVKWSGMLPSPGHAGDYFDYDDLYGPNMHDTGNGFHYSTTQSKGISNTQALTLTTT